MQIITTSLSSAKNTNDYLVDWNVLKNMQKINDYVYNHPMTTKQLVADPEFIKIVTNTPTADSYACLFDKDLIAYIHPNKSLLGKNLTRACPT